MEDASTDPIRVGYRPGQDGALIECLTLGSLRERYGDRLLAHHERIEFDLVVAPERGRATHEVDFEMTTLDPHNWLHVRPGQVHRWHPSDIDATLILLGPTPTSPHWRPGPHLLTFSDAQLDSLAVLIDLVRRSTVEGGPTNTNRVARGLRELVIGWLDLDRVTDSGNELYEQFRRLLQNDPETRSVEHIARRLGCSPRTLARACERAGAPSPKRLIDESVLLHAQRLLALPNATVSTAARALGFDEVTNFTKFFKRVGGTTPSEFQLEAAA